MLQKEPTQPSAEYAEPLIEYGEVHAYFEAHRVHLGDVTSSQDGREIYGPMLVSFVADKTAEWPAGVASTFDDPLPEATLQHYFSKFEGARRRAKQQGKLADFNAKITGPFEQRVLDNAYTVPEVPIAQALVRGLGNNEVADIARDIVLSLGLYCEHRAQTMDKLVRQLGTVSLVKQPES